MGLIVINKGNGVINNDNSPAPKYKINKNYDSWKSIKKGSKAITNNGNDSLPIMVTTITNNGNGKSPQPPHNGRSRASKESIKYNKDKRERDARARPLLTHSLFVDFFESGDAQKNSPLWAEYVRIKNIITEDYQRARFVMFLKEPPRKLMGLELEAQKWEENAVRWNKRQQKPNGSTKPKPRTTPTRPNFAE